MRRALLVAAWLAPAAAAAQAIVIEGATVWTAPGRKLEGATIVVQGGRIAAVGAAAQAPPDARRIDGRGKVVTAGLIDAYTRIGLVEIDLEAASNDADFASDPGGIHAAYRVVDGYNPLSVAIPVARAGGVTSVIAVPAGGLAAGASGWMLLHEAIAADAVVARAPLAMHVALGGPALASSGGSRGRAVERLRELLDDAAQYARRRADYERNQTRRFAASRLDLEALAQVTAGRLPLVVNADRATDILAALRLAAERRVRIAVAGAAEAWLVADRLAAARVPVILDPSDNLPTSFDRLRVRGDAAAVLAKAGVAVSLSSMGGSANVGALRQLAGLAVAAGLSWDDALAAVTRNPAELFARPPGEPARGVIAPGAAADLVVWSGDPFEIATRVEHVLIGGAPQPLVTRQTRLLERYRRVP
jgi:imidazolonepropionase-like amidohydrolase